MASKEKNDAQSTVGKSHRTPFKHFVLDKTLGSWAGRIAPGYIKFIWGDMHIVDLCAGDGEPGEHGLSSPQIIDKHASWSVNEMRRRGSRSRVHVTLIEKNAHTCDKLKSNISATGFYNLNVVNGDAREFTLEVGSKNEAAFINADPNNIKQMPLAEPLVDSFPKLTTMTLTLGCNVGGVKRRPREEREEWFEYVRMCAGKMRSYHDAIICRVVRDDAQWAYLSIIPSADTNKYIPILKKEGARHFDHGVDVVSFRSNNDIFWRQVDKLFLLQKKEYTPCEGVTE